MFIASVQKLFPVENSSSKSLSEISLFEGQKPDAGLTSSVMFSKNGVISHSRYRLFRHFFGSEKDLSPLVILVRGVVCRNKKGGSPG